MVNNLQILNQLRVNSTNFFTSIAQILDDTDTNSNDLNVNKLRKFVNGKVPDDTHFSIPFITTVQVMLYIKQLV